jgi:hypothetical protein
MKHLTATLCLTIAVLLGSAGVSFALPPCPSDRHGPTCPWLFCFGTFTHANGDKYVGEFWNNKRHGQGTYTDARSRKKHVGEWKNNNMHGQGAVITAGGQILKEGIWTHGKLQYAVIHL